MADKLTITVMLGGPSAEREVSLRSGAEVSKALRSFGHKVHEVDPKEPWTLPRGTDVVFLALHGPYGEDGTLQGLLEMADVPYVGCGVLASSCGMDKVTMKSLFVQAGLPICKHIWFLRSQWRNDPGKVLRKVVADIGLPCFVKPANLGSSVGVSRAADKKALTEAIDLAAQYERLERRVAPHVRH